MNQRERTERERKGDGSEGEQVWAEVGRACYGAIFDRLPEGSKGERPSRRLHGALLLSRRSLPPSGELSMLKALAWKEYREQRQIALVGLLTMAMLPVLFIAIGYGVNGWGFSFEPRDLFVLSTFGGGTLVWPVFAAVAGAATNPREAHVASLGFLLSRPVPRMKVWAVKVGIGLAALATVIGGSVTMFSATMCLLWGPKIFPQFYPDLADVAWYVGILALAFACSVFYATHLASSLVVAVAGLVTCAGIHAFAISFWMIVGLRRELELASVTVIFVVTPVVLAGSVYAYTRGELLRGQRLRKMFFVEVTLALVALLALSIGIAFALTRVTRSNAIFTNPKLSPAGNFVAIGANRKNISAEQIWLIDLEGTTRQLTGRWSQSMAFSPDGEWLAYSRLSALFGFLPGVPELRVTRVDGSEDRFLGLRVGERPTFSPDGTRIAASYWNDLAIARLDREEVGVLELPGRFEARDVAWSPDGRELLLIAPNQTIAFYDLQSRDLRLFEPPENWPDWFSYPLSADRPVPARIPVHGYWLVPTEYPDARRRTRREYGIGLIDRKTLDGETLTRGTCWLGAMDLSADEKHLVYSTCGERGPVEQQPTQRGSVVRLHNLESGEDRALTTLRGSIGNLSFNPSGGSIAASTRAGPLIIRIGEGDLSTVLNLREEDPGPRGGWLPVGWLDDSRLMLAQRPSESSYGRAHLWPARIPLPPQIEVGNLAILDIETGEQRTVFER